MKNRVLLEHYFLRLDAQLAAVTEAIHFWQNEFRHVYGYDDRQFDFTSLIQTCRQGGADTRLL